MDREPFDDVTSHVVEEPEPPRPRRPRRMRRWAVGGVAAVVVAGGLAAGASALTSSPGRPPAKPGAAAARERALPGDPSGSLSSGRVGCHHRFHGGPSTATLRPTE